MPDPTERLNPALEGRYTVERELGEGGMATKSDQYRKPPDNWPPAIASLARDRALELVKLAEELEKS